MDQVRKSPLTGVWSLILAITTSFSWKTGLSLGLGKTGMPQAAQHQWSRGGAFPAKGHILVANDSSCWEGSAGQRETIKGFPNWLTRSLPNPTVRECRASSWTSRHESAHPTRPGGSSSPLRQDSCQSDARATSAPQVFSSSLGAKAHFGQLLPPRASNSYSFGGLLLNRVS